MILPSKSSVPVVQEIYSAFSRRDVPALFRLLSPEIEMVQSDQLPWGGTYRGQGGAMAFFGKLTGQITSVVAVERMIDAGEAVVVVGRTKGTINGSGAAYDVPVAHVWKIRDGAAVRAEFYIDTPGMLTALAGRK